LTAKNIETFIEGKGSPIITKQEPDSSYNANKLLIQNLALRDNDLAYYSVLTKYQPTLPYQGTVTCDDSNGYRICLSNQDILSIYQVAYDPGEDDGGRGLLGLPRFLTLFEVSDTSPYCSLKNGIEQTENEYCYEMRVPHAGSFRELKSIMQSDIKRYFHLNARMERRLTPCWVMQSDDTMTVKSINEERVLKINEYSLDFQNAKLAVLFKMLRHRYMENGKYPILDETGISGPVTIHLVADMSSPEALNKALAAYKMHFRLENRWVDMLVVQETSESLTGINNIRNYKSPLNGD
jgi:hypothetical protein